MTQTQHTPGPWQYWPSIGQVNRPGDPNQICNIPPNGDKKPADENDANARLIAAAPELLEALEMVVNIATHPKATKADIKRIAEEARAALAKAKGGNNA